MRLAALALALLFLLPAGAQPPTLESTLSEAWTRTLRDALVALPLERPQEAETAWGALDRMAQAFARSQRMLGDEGSGPMLAAAAPDAESLVGAGSQREALARFLAQVQAFRAGTLTPQDHASASRDLAHVGHALERTQPASLRHAATTLAWQEADAWYQRLRPLATEPAPAPRVIPGNATPGSDLPLQVHAAPGNATLQTPWGSVDVGPGSSLSLVPVPAGQAPGSYAGTLVVDGRPVANFTLQVQPVPLVLDVLGPRHVQPGGNATYRVSMRSPIQVSQPGTFAVEILEGGSPRSIDVVQDTFTLQLATDEARVTVRGGPGPPWQEASTTFTVRAAAAAPSPSPPYVGLVVVVAAPLAVLLAALFLRQQGGAPSPLAAANPHASLASRLRAWWSSPESAVAADYRRAARILGESGGLEPGATHAQVAAALELHGIRPKVARRLAWAYEQVQYAGEDAQPEYWQARRSP